MGKERIYENLAENIGLEKFKRIDRKQRKVKAIITNTFTLAICTLSITGMVFAKEISTKVYENFFGTGNGVGKAIEEGYIETPEVKNEVVNTTAINKDTGEKIEDLETTVKVTEFVMDDFTLSMTFEVEFSEEAKKKISPLDIGDMEFSDMVIYDENNVVLYCMLVNRFNEFCKEHNLDYDFDTVPDDKYINCGVNAYATERTEDSVKMIYNIYTGGGVSYPKSKKLCVDLNKIKLEDNDETTKEEENIILQGDWNFSVDVPKKMYNRNNVIYTQKSTTNEDFNVTAATLYDTGMDISLDLKIERETLEPPTTPELEFYESLPEEHELKTLDIYNYLYKKLWYTEEYKKYMEDRMSVWQFEKYLINEEGEKFELTQGPKPNGSGNIDIYNIYHFNGMFDLTKYDMTDTITLYVDYKGKKAEIVLEKVEE